VGISGRDSGLYGRNGGPSHGCLSRMRVSIRSADPRRTTNHQSRTLASVELIDMQPELQWYMRPYLVDFLIEVHSQNRLRPETLYLALNIVDRYVSKRIVFKKHYQLVGCAALWIAAKFEDAKDRVPTVNELSQMCCGAYDESAFVQMEGHVLSTIGWLVGHPTAEAWLRLACTPAEEYRTQHIARFLMEITLFSRAFVPFLPSQLAAASLTLARFMTGKSRRVSYRSVDAPAPCDS
jgi:Cyclin, N-terminal domain/Cyclin, C-terminal domain